MALVIAVQDASMMGRKQGLHLVFFIGFPVGEDESDWNEALRIKPDMSFVFLGSFPAVCPFYGQGTVEEGPVHGDQIPQLGESLGENRGSIRGKQGKYGIQLLSSPGIDGFKEAAL